MLTIQIRKSYITFLYIYKILYFLFISWQISSLFGIKTTQGNIGRSIDEEELTWDPVKFIMENKNEKVINYYECY